MRALFSTIHSIQLFPLIFSLKTWVLACLRDSWNSLLKDILSKTPVENLSLQKSNYLIIVRNTPGWMSETSVYGTAHKWFHSWWVGRWNAIMSNDLRVNMSEICTPRPSLLSWMPFLLFWIWNGSHSIFAYLFRTWCNGAEASFGQLLWDCHHHECVPLRFIQWIWVEWKNYIMKLLTFFIVLTMEKSYNINIIVTTYRENQNHNMIRIVATHRITTFYHIVSFMNVFVF